MKTILLTALVLGLVAGGVFAQADMIIKQRAKELSNQNNVRQGVPPPATTPPAKAPPAKTATPSTPASPQQQSIARLKADIAALGGSSAAGSEQKLQFVRDLLAAARGTVKPSQATVTRFANSLGAALADKTVTAESQTRLAQNIEAVLNGANLPVSQTQAIADDVQAILQTSAVPRATAVGVAADLKAVAAEVQKKG